MTLKIVLVNLFFPDKDNICVTDQASKEIIANILRVSNLQSSLA